MVGSDSPTPCVELRVKVVPGAADDRIVGWLNRALKIRVRKPAEDGKANASVEKILADALGLHRKSVRVLRGRSAPRKVIAITGMKKSEVYERLSAIVS